MDKTNKPTSPPSMGKSETQPTVAKEIGTGPELDSSLEKTKCKEMETQEEPDSRSTSKIDPETDERDKSDLDEDSKVDTPLRTWLDFKKLNEHMTEALPELEKYLNECDFKGKSSRESVKLIEQIDMLLLELSKQDPQPDKPDFDKEVSNMKSILGHIKESIEKAQAGSNHPSPSQESLPIKYTAHYGKIHHVFRNRPKKRSNNLPMKSHSETNTQKTKSILQGSKSASSLHRAVHSNHSAGVSLAVQSKQPLVFPKSHRPYVNRRKPVDLNEESDENYIANINRLTIGTVRTRRSPTKTHFQNTLFETVHQAKITEPDRLSIVSNFPRHASYTGKYLGDPIEVYIPDSAQRHKRTKKSLSVSSKSSIMDGRGDMERRIRSDSSSKQASGHDLTEKGKVNRSSSKKLSFGNDGVVDAYPSDRSCNVKGSGASLPRIDSKYGPLAGKGSSYLSFKPTKPPLVHHHQTTCSACGRKARCLACEQDARSGTKTISCHQRLHKSKTALYDKKNELFRPVLRGDTIEQPSVLEGLDLTNPLVLYNLKGCSQAEECYWELVCDTLKRCKGTSYIYFLSDHKRHCCDACNREVDKRVEKSLYIRSFIKPPNSEMYCENNKTQSLL